MARSISHRPTFPHLFAGGGLLPSRVRPRPRGANESATLALSCSEALFEEIGVGDTNWARRQNRNTEASLRETLDDDGFAEAWEQGCALMHDEAVSLALDALA